MKNREHNLKNPKILYYLDIDCPDPFNTARIVCARFGFCWYGRYANNWISALRYSHVLFLATSASNLGNRNIGNNPSGVCG